MVDLAARDRDLTELMDDPDCDPAALDRTYAQFRVVNGLLAGWRRLYRRRLRPLLSPNRCISLLDVGCGGGDVARALARWAARDDLRLSVTAIDPDPRAYAYATARPAIPGLTVRRCTTVDLVSEGRRFDVVTSNHLLHHLDERELAGLLRDSAALARRLVLHNDLARARLAYGAFGALSLLAGTRSLLRTDGLRSIRRSYRPAELAVATPPGWRVERFAPFRLLLSYEVPGG